MSAVPRAVWIDLCGDSRRRSTFLDARSTCDILHLAAPELVHAAVLGHRPQFVCIEFDYPDETRLGTVPLVRHKFPHLPVLVLTDFHSEALAVWMFRQRVWDYRVKPIDMGTLARLIDAVMRPSRLGPRECWVSHPLPSALIAPAGHLHGPLVSTQRTAAAVAYVSQHYDESIGLKLVAGLCHLCRSEFSRDFHREQGMPFRLFLLRYRINRARDLLIERDTTVSQAAFAVGFDDLAYFARSFKRFVGMSATQYQHQMRM